MAVPHHPAGLPAARNNGLVIVVGAPPSGPRNALALAAQLQKLGSKVPIEVFYAASDNMEPSMLDALSQFAIVRAIPNAAGFQLKPLAMAHTSFDEVLMIDADNVPTVAPDFLFDEPSYRTFGNMFWPDYPVRTLQANGELFFQDLRVPMVPLHAGGGSSASLGAAGYETESGMILFNKTRHGPALQHVVRLNTPPERTNTYSAVYGDKDTWRIGFFLAGVGSDFNQIVTAPRAVLIFRNRRWEHLAMAHAMPGEDGGAKVLWIHRTMKQNKELTPSSRCDYVSPPLSQSLISSTFGRDWDRDALIAKLPSRLLLGGRREEQRRSCTKMLRSMSDFLVAFDKKILPEPEPTLRPPRTRSVWQTVRSHASIPSQGQECMASWPHINPAWSIRVLNDTDVDTWVATHFNSTITAAFRRLPLGVMRADVWRYMVMYIHGGLYSDADTRCLAPIEAWWEPACKVVVGQETDKHFTQWTLASSEPGHPLFKAVLEVVFRRMLAPLDTRNEHFVHHVTGPAAFTAGVFAYLNSTGRQYASVNAVMQKEPGPDTHGACFFDIFRGKTNKGNPVVTNEFGSQKWADSWINERRILVDKSSGHLREALLATPDVGLDVGVAHARGMWMQTESATATKAFVCCANEDDAIWRVPPSSTAAEQCRTTMMTPSSWGMASHEGCSCDADDPAAVHAREVYEWVPAAMHNKMKMAFWDEDKFCRLLGNRTILFIGDSTLHQASTTLRARVRRAGCGVQISWAEADTLVGEPLGWMNRGKAWYEHVRDQSPSIVVMGLGPHVRPRAKFEDAMRTYEGAVGDLFRQIAELRLELPGVEVFWKTVSAGHAAVGQTCHDAKVPLREAPDFAGFVGTPNWRYFPAFDGVAVPAMRAAGCRILDMSPTYLRPDSHVVSDCLHFCEPGPVGQLVAAQLLAALRDEKLQVQLNISPAGANADKVMPSPQENNSDSPPSVDDVPPELRHLQTLVGRTASTVASSIRARWFGRGIVVALSPTREGQLDLLTLLHVLRRDQNCTLPVEIFYADAGEVTPSLLTALSKFQDVEAVDASTLAPAGMSLRGFQIKAFALMHSRFAEVLLLDSDCMPARDPTLLFSDHAYQKKGSLFWPDFPTQLGDAAIFRALRVPPPRIYIGDFGAGEDAAIDASDYETDSAAMVVNKVRHENAVRMIYGLNVHHRIVYRFLWGDKDTFRLGFFLAGEGHDYAQSRVAPSAAFSCVPGKECQLLAMVHYSPSPPHVLQFVHRSQAQNKDYSRRVKCDALTLPFSVSFLAEHGHDRLPISHAILGRFARSMSATAEMRAECTKVVVHEADVVQTFRGALELSKTRVADIVNYHADLRHSRNLRRLGIRPKVAGNIRRLSNSSANSSNVTIVSNVTVVKCAASICTNVQENATIDGKGCEASARCDAVADGVSIGNVSFRGLVNRNEKLSTISRYTGSSAHRRRSYTSKGGAVSFSKTGSISHCVFEKCSATAVTTGTSATVAFAYGGAVSFSKTARISHCEFQECSATVHALDSLHGESYAYGGAVHFSATGIVSSSSFCSNSAKSPEGYVYAYGGAVHFSNTGTVSSSSFCSNSATANAYVYGGAVHFEKPGIVSSSLFQFNSAKTTSSITGRVFGGGICFKDAGSVKASSFSANEVTSQYPRELTSNQKRRGAAIAFLQEAFLDDCVFQGAKSSAPALYSEGGWSLTAVHFVGAANNNTGLADNVCSQSFSSTSDQIATTCYASVGRLCSVRCLESSGRKAGEHLTCEATANSITFKGTSTCVFCIAGKFANANAPSLCFDCPAGFVSALQDSTTCDQCAAGTYASKNRSTSCKTCPAGHFSDHTPFAGTAQCTYCGAGTYRPNAGAGSCVQCVATQLCTGNVSEPELCPLGFYCPVDKSTQRPDGTKLLCTRTGSYCPPGSVEQTVCERGFVCPDASTRVPCNAKEYCPPNSTAETKMLCPAGHFCSADAKNKFSCLGGYHCPEGTTTMRKCPEGFRCPFDFDIGRPTGEIFPCNTTASSYCPEGSVAETPVSAGFYATPVGGPRFWNQAKCEKEVTFCKAGVKHGCGVCVPGTRIETNCQRMSDTKCEACPTDAFQSRSGQSSCSTCSKDSTSSSDRTRCVCKDNFLASVFNILQSPRHADKCTPCGDGLDCAWKGNDSLAWPDRAHAKPGYWQCAQWLGLPPRGRPTEGGCSGQARLENAKSSSPVLRRCPHRDVPGVAPPCVGGENWANCSGYAYAGPLCAACAAGHYKNSSRHCSPCDANAQAAGISGIVAIPLLLAVLAYCMWPSSATSRRTSSVSGKTTAWQRATSLADGAYNAYNRVIGEKMKITLTYGQLLFAFTRSEATGTEWPLAFVEFIDSMGALVNLNLFSFARTSCTFGTTFLSESFLVAGTQLAVLGVGLLVVALRPKGMNTSTVKQGLVLLTFLFYTGLNNTLCSVFTCVRLEDRALHLAGDLRVLCYEGEHATYAGMAGLMVFLFSICVPVGLAWILYRANKAGRLYAATSSDRNDKTPKPSKEMAYLGSMYSRYEPHAYWFESVHLLFKLWFSGVLVILGTTELHADTTSDVVGDTRAANILQLVCGMLALLLYLVISGIVQPYHDLGDDIQWIVSLSALLLCAFLAMLMQADFATKLGVTVNTLGAMLVAIGIVPIALGILRMLLATGVLVHVGPCCRTKQSRQLVKVVPARAAQGSTETNSKARVISIRHPQGLETKVSATQRHSAAEVQHVLARVHRVGDAHLKGEINTESELELEEELFEYDKEELMQLLMTDYESEHAKTEVERAKAVAAHAQLEQEHAKLEEERSRAAKLEHEVTSLRRGAIDKHLQKAEDEAKAKQIMADHEAEVAEHQTQLKQQRMETVRRSRRKHKKQRLRFAMKALHTEFGHLEDEEIRRCLDPSGDGEISMTELWTAIQKRNMSLQEGGTHKLTRADAQRIIEELDDSGDGDGVVSVGELLAGINELCKQISAKTKNASLANTTTAVTRLESGHRERDSNDDTEAAASDGGVNSTTPPAEHQEGNPDARRSPLCNSPRTMTCLSRGGSQPTRTATASSHAWRPSRPGSTTNLTGSSMRCQGMGEQQKEEQQGQFKIT